jgi:hypothetical protein
MDYECGSKRKTKKDLKKKRQYRVYKRGGKFRTTEVKETDNKKKKGKK